MVMGAVVARILTQYSDKGSKQAQKDIAKLQKRIDAFGKKAAKSFAVAAAASAALAYKIGKDSVKAAIEQQKSQALLANSLKNSLGVTDEQISAIEKYIDKTEILTNVQDTELRSSFSQLAIAFGNITDATLAQGVALDVAAGTGKDLSLVSDAITKASQGNFTALKKIIPTLDANIVKNKDLGAALTYATKTYKGAAKAAADRDPWTRLETAFGNLQKQLGIVLLPVVIDFTNYLIEEVIPALEEWIALNQDKLQQSLQDVTDILKDFIKQGPTILQLLKGISDILAVLNTPIAGITSLFNLVVYGILIKRAYSGISNIFGGINKEVLTTGKRYDVVAQKQGPVIKALQWLLSKGKIVAGIIYGIATAFTTMGIRAGISAIGVALATAGANIYAALPALAAIGVTAFATKRYMDSLKDSTDKTSDSIKKFGSVSRQAIAGPAALAKAQAAAAAEEAARLARLKAMQAEQDKKDKEAKARAAQVLKLQKQITALSGQKVRSEDDPIQLEAARLLLIKQGNLLELEKLKRITEEVALIKLRNDYLTKYQDILQALQGDNKITANEINLLALKWGMAREQVELYLQGWLAVADYKITTEEIDKYATSWFMTTDQAKKYLQALQAIQDGVVTTEEIEYLRNEWNVTVPEVKKYLDFVRAIEDQTLTDTEVAALKKEWGLSNDQVSAYLLQIGKPFNYHGSMLSGIDSLIEKLKQAIELMKQLQGGSTTTKPIVPVVPVVPVTPVTPVKPITPVTPDTSGSRDSHAAAAAYAAAKAAGDMTAAAIAAAGVSPSALAAQESGAIGAASIAAQLRAAEEALAQQQHIATYAAFKAKERADEMAAASNSLSSTSAYDPYADEAEKARIRRMQGFQSTTLSNASGISGGNLMAAPIVNITVQGSVTAEDDLVQTVRNGLLATQYNGNSINLLAV